MLILGIESSCDDTSVALVDCSEAGHFIIAEKTASQIEIHQKYGGVVPEIAGRMHAEKIVPLIESICAEATPDKVDRIHPDVIAVTTGPGLITGLIVGAEAARTLAYAWDIPLISVNHLDGHIHSVEIFNSQFSIFNKIEFPAITLLVSGGHTELVLMKNHGEYEKLGATKDDAAGECFDKTAKLLGIPYPGGPQISKLAETGNSAAIKFPRPMIDEKIDFSAQGGPAYGWDFSFSGLKTSVLYWLQKNNVSPSFQEGAQGGVAGDANDGNPSMSPLSKGRIPATQPAKITINDFCASFEQAIVDVLTVKTLKAVEKLNPKTVILAGGVAANKKLRETLGNELKHKFPETKFMVPELKYSMDNAAMIAVAGYYQAKKNNFTDWKDIQVDPNWRL